MKTAFTLLAVAVGLLSMAAGGAKIALIPEEAEFLRQFGFDNTLTTVFGVAQVLGGLLMILPPTRFQGALIAAVGFALSMVLVLLSGNLAFASVSLVPVLLAGLVAYQARRRA